MPAGRPTKYTPKLVQMAREYVDSGWKKVKEDVIPSHIGMAKYIGINRLTLYDWAGQKSKEEFSNILDDCMAAQQRVLISKGLDSTFNSAIVKLVLGKHGYHDKQDRELSGPSGGPIDNKWTVEIVDTKNKEDGDDGN